MSAVIELIRQLVAAFAIMPFITFFGIWFVCYRLYKDKKRATRIAMDITSVLLLGSILSMSLNLFGSSMLFWFVVLLFLVAAALIGKEQNRKYGRVQTVKLLKLLSRLGFFLLSALYFILLIVGIGHYMSMT